MMSSIVPYHNPNTIYLAHMGVLGYTAQVYGLSTKSVASRYVPHNPLDGPVRLSLRTLHRRYNILHLLAPKQHAILISRKAFSKMAI